MQPGTEDAAVTLAKLLPGTVRHDHPHPLDRVRARPRGAGHDPSTGWRCECCDRPIFHGQWMWACPSCPTTTICVICGSRQPPTVVQLWLDGKEERTDVNQRRQQAAATTKWLGGAVIAAHIDPSIKDAARQLLVQRDFTPNIEVPTHAPFLSAWVTLSVQKYS